MFGQREVQNSEQLLKPLTKQLGIEQATVDW